MDGALELDEATIRSVAAALTDSAGELEQLADRLSVTLAADHARPAEVVREWARRTAADAARLTGAVDRYVGQDTHAAVTFERTGS